jgi:hypothetical protein
MWKRQLGKKENAKPHDAFISVVDSINGIHYLWKLD